MFLTHRDDLTDATDSWADGRRTRVCSEGAAPIVGPQRKKLEHALHCEDASKDLRMLCCTFGICNGAEAPECS